jgi:hypothetical protein
MAKLVIRDTHPNLDGEYEYDLSDGFNGDEWYLMKKHVGVVTADVLPGAPLDMNVLNGFGLVFLHRAGKDHLFPAFMAAKDAQKVWDMEDEATEDETVPTMSGSADSGTPPEQSEPSGPSTNGGSDATLEIVPLATGSQPSATFATSGLETSAT